MESIMNIEVKIKKLSDKAIVPTKGSAEAAGADLYALCEEEITLEPGETMLIHTGIAAELPPLTVGLVFSRSGIALKKGLAPANKVGVIDSDYRGEIMVALHNHSNKPQTIVPGERIAQLVVIPYYSAAFSVVDELSSTERASGGFGSTGTK